MNILLLGSGGREHAFAWKITQSKMCRQLFIAPGNAGTALLGKNVNLKPTDFHQLRDFIMRNKIKMVVVGPEEPLVKGISEFFSHDVLLRDIVLIGPPSTGARLEGSKKFAKEFMFRHNIPTAKYQSFSAENLNEADAFIDSLKAPYVLKADGLAAGKGVLILADKEKAKSEIREIILDGKFGVAGKTVVVEEFLDGVEVSVFVLTDGKSFLILPEAKDYKRVGEGNTGLNTGGMGAVSPVPFADECFMSKVKNQIIWPTIQGLQSENIEYKGFIFIGLMNIGGEPYVIEYNVRLGDPEAEVVLPRIKSDLVELFMSVFDGTLHNQHLEIEERTAVTVMLVSGGYPGAFEKGKEISGLRDFKDSYVFHAGTKLTEENGRVVTSGGRVLAVTSLSWSIEEAAAISYKNAEDISFENMYFRRDIGKDLQAR